MLNLVNIGKNLKKNIFYEENINGLEYQLKFIENSLNKVQEERINLQIKEIEEFKQKKADLEVSLNDNIVKYKLTITCNKN